MINQPGITSVTIGGVTQYGGSIEFSVPGATIDPGTGEITIPTGGTGQALNEFTLDAAQATQKYVILSAAPTEVTKTTLNVSGLGPQFYGLDYVVTADDGGKRLSWSGLGLNDLLEVGDYITVYFS
jgi:hypothetical protein